MTTAKPTPEMRIPEGGKYLSMSHLVREYRNETPDGNCEMLVDGFGWCRFSNRLCAVLIGGKWWTY